MPRSTWVFALLLLLVTAGGAFADITMQFGSPGSNIWQDVYSSPYTATDSATGDLLTLYCIDFNDEIDPPTTWQANINALSPSNISDFQFGGISSHYVLTFNGTTITATSTDLSTSGLSPYDLYLEAAWLMGQAANQTLQVSEQEYQVAAWSLFVNSSNTLFANSPNIDTLTTWIDASGPVFAQAVVTDLGQARANYGKVDAADWSVVTGDSAANGEAVQEFLIHTPEPSAVILFGTVLLLVCTALRRRMRLS